ncbi:hypothetical protein Tco_0161634 [Tanacetum coccineum]
MGCRIFRYSEMEKGHINNGLVLRTLCRIPSEYEDIFQMRILPTMKYIFSDVNPLYNEVLEDIESKDSYVSKLDEPVLLVTPLSDANKDECFDLGGDINEIDAFLDIDVSMNIKDGYC